MTDCTSPDSTELRVPRILWTLGSLHGELRLRHGLSLHAYLVLGALAEASNGYLHTAELTAFLGESGDRMTYVLKGMQASGLIDRNRSEQDRRTVKVTLTNAGRAKAADAEKTAQALVRRYLVPSLTAGGDS
ncbi:MarR family winged helix-turn-helix transcriptional regulator [Streptomyces sp. NPDC002306]